MLHSGQDGLRNVVRPFGRIHNLAAPGLVTRDFKERRPQAFVICQPLRLEPIRSLLRASGGGAGEADLRGKIEDQGEVRTASASGDLFQRADESRVHLAQRALIDARGIREAVANHEGAARQRWQDRLRHMVDARRRKQHRLSRRSQRRRNAGQDHLAQGLRHRRTAGLAGDDAVVAEAAQMFGQQPGLGGFTSPLPAFQRDELAPSCRGHCFMTYLRNRDWPSSRPASKARRCNGPIGTASPATKGASIASVDPR